GRTHSTQVDDHWFDVGGQVGGRGAFVLPLLALVVAVCVRAVIRFCFCFCFCFFFSFAVIAYFRFQWVGGTHDRLRALCARLGIQLFAQYDEGNHLLEVDGAVHQYRGNISTLNSNGALDGLDQAVDALDTLAASLDATAPWTSAQAKEWCVWILF